jgi:2-dehydropantoate 2-reductase
LFVNVAIVGIGAMGCRFGSALNPHCDVTLIGRWRKQLQVLNSAPLKILQNGHETEVKLHATDDESQVPPSDVVLVLTKSSKTDLAAQAASKVLKSDGLVITLQNGLGNYERLVAELGEQRVTLGVTMQGASMDAPGVLRLGGSGPTYLASRPEIHDKIEAIAELFDTSGLQTSITEDVWGLVWGKLAINAAINPLTAILRVRNGRLLSSDWSKSIMREAALEVATVADAQGIPLSFNDAATEAERVAMMTANNRSSMLQDVIRGVRTEIDSICGEIMRRAEQFGVPVPANRLLYTMVKALEDMN